MFVVFQFLVYFRCLLRTILDKGAFLVSAVSNLKKEAFFQKLEI
ncbi:hypothetical protein TcasGA2_TC032754 [Tribolium castaneum]|uniref:Uncharacterized protein n=1 Tax=Tribolium castaneum TaxID=7070 RepID=A0A139WJ65_TRICA|nr:hypothetical protein TcasGA2_TC032754 [Tribolium castaneum]